MKLFKLISTVGIAAAFIGAVAACSSSDTGATPSGGSGCALYGTKCGGAQAAAATDACKKVVATAAAACQSKYEAVWECYANNNCTVTNTGPCKAATDAYTSCGSSGNGGSAGAGGSSGNGGSSNGGSSNGGSSNGGSSNGGSSNGGSSNGGSANGGSAGSAGGYTLPAACEITETQPCNPMTNEGCASGQACDWSETTIVECYPPPPPNTAKIGEACSSGTVFCAGGGTCQKADADASTGTCYKFCCADSDCTSPATCQTDGSTGKLGICL